MKKLSLAFVLCLCCVTFICAQEYRTPERKPYQRNSYARISYLNPFGSFGENFSQGVTLESGRIFNIASLPLPEELQGGIDWTFGEVSFQSRNQRIQSFTDSITGGFLVSLGTKFGAILSYNPTDLLIFDVYAKYFPALIIARKEIYDNQHGPGSSDLRTGWGVSFANNFSTGLTARYVNFSVGMELCFGATSVNYSSEIEPIIQHSEGKPRIVGHKKDASIGFSSARISLGFWF